MVPASRPRPVLAAWESFPRWLRRCVEAMLKGFAIGSGLKGSLALLSALVRISRIPKKSTTAMTNAEAVVRAVEETVRYGVFLGTFAGTYVAADERIAAIWGRERSAYILNKDSFPSSYKAFLGKQIGKDPIILQGLKELVIKDVFTNLAGIEKFYRTVGVDLQLDPKMKIPCSILHGDQSCTGHFFSFLLQAYGRALPVYVPVYLIPMLFVHRTHLIKRPFSILWKNLLGTARSSLFLSVYCASEWGWTCLLFRAFQRCNIPLLVLGTFPTGLALLIEKKSRRIEISLYCLARAIESFSTCMVDIELLPPELHIKRADVIAFSIATSITMHCYEQERKVFRSKYLNVLDWVFGVPTPSSTNENKQNVLHS